MVGYLTATSQEQAIAGLAEAPQSSDDDKLPVLLEFKFETNNCYFRLNRQEFTPYAKSEDSTLL